MENQGRRQPMAQGDGESITLDYKNKKNGRKRGKNEGKIKKRNEKKI